MADTECILDSEGKTANSVRYRGNAHHVISKGKGIKVKDPVSGNSEKPDKIDVYDDHEKIRRAIYGRTPKAVAGETGVKSGDRTHTGRYFFVYPKVNPVNFAPAGAGTPYPNQAHHLIPNQLYYQTAGEPMGEVLRRVDYDINNGNNLIFLPVHEDNCEIHDLPQHKGSHPQYTKMVKSEINRRLRGEINKMKREACGDKWKPGTDIPAVLYDIQDEYWDYLCNCGGSSRALFS